MKPVRVLGIGSPFGADRVGWQAIDVLAAIHDWPVPVILEKCDRPGLALLEGLRDTDKAILIDAVVTEDEAAIRILEMDELAVATPLSTHDAGLAETLALGARLGMLPQRLTIVGLPVPPHALADEIAIQEAELIRVVRAILAGQGG